MTPKTARVLIAVVVILAAWYALSDYEAAVEALAIGLIIAIKRSTLP